MALLAGVQPAISASEMDHRVFEVGHLDLIDQANDQTRPSDLLTGLETTVSAIGEIGQNRSPLALGDRHAGE